MDLVMKIFTVFMHVTKFYNLKKKENTFPFAAWCWNILGEKKRIQGSKQKLRALKRDHVDCYMIFFNEVSSI